MSSTTYYAWPPGDEHDLLNPQAHLIDFGWLALRLARLPRFNAGTRDPYFVAQHSVVVCDNCSGAAKPYGLLHDGREGLIGDQTRPFINALDQVLGARGPVLNPFSVALESIGRAWDEAVFRAAGLPPITDAIAKEVAEIDREIGNAEHAQLVKGERSSRLGGMFSCWSTEKAHEEFLRALRVYAPLANISPWPESVRSRHGR